MKHLLKHTLNALFLTLFLALTGCGSGDSGGTAAPSTSTVDTDGDGLTDYKEVNVYHTSELLTDTDGDQLSDFDEVTTSGAAKALVSNLPNLEISIVGSATVDLAGAIKTGCTTGATSSTLDAHSSNFSRSNSAATSTTIKKSLEISASAGYSFPGGSVSASTKTGYSNDSTSTNSSSWTAGSATNAQNAFEASKSCLDESSTTGGTVTIGFKIENFGDNAVNLTALGITLLQVDPQDPTNFITLGTADLNSSLNGRLTIGAGGSAGPLTATVLVGARKAMDLWANPSGLLFKVGYKEMTDQNNVNYAWIDTDVINQTGGIVIDFGAARQDGNNRNVVKRYRVATNVLRNADLTPKGITLGDALTNILHIPYTLTSVDVLQADGNITTRSVFASIDGVAIDQTLSQLWFLSSDSATLNDPTFASVEDILLLPDTFIDLTLLRDTDGDGLFDREEFVLGTDETLADTDGDGLSDYNETRIGWIDGFSGEQIYSSPLLADMDGDGLSDSAELNKTTNPRNIDTDYDGISDDKDTADATAAITPLIPPIVWTMASTSEKHSAGIKSDGTLWVWGSNDAQQLGLGDTQQRNTPVQLPFDADSDGTADSDWKYVNAGWMNTFALKQDGTLWVWGYDGYGVLGKAQTPTTSITSIPTQIVIAGESITKVSSRGSSSMILTQSGKIYMTGYNYYGSLGQGDTTNRDTFTQVGSATDWVDISASGGISVGLKSDGTVWGWGYNNSNINSYAIMDTLDSFYTVPQNILTLTSGQAKISSGVGVMAISTDTGAMYIRGQGVYGSRGIQAQANGGWIDQLALYGNSFKDGCSDGYISMGIDFNGALYSWGDTRAGQRGIGTINTDTTTNYIKTRVGDSANWTTVICGRGHPMAINANGDLYAWGEGRYGALGNGSLADSYVPVKVNNP